MLQPSIRGSNRQYKIICPSLSTPFKSFNRYTCNSIHVGSFAICLQSIKKPYFRGQGSEEMRLNGPSAVIEQFVNLVCNIDRLVMWPETAVIQSGISGGSLSARMSLLITYTITWSQVMNTHLMHDILVCWIDRDRVACGYAKQHPCVLPVEVPCTF